MVDPYFMARRPCLISFSGGRTSAYLVAKILEAHGGQLPTDVHVLFANTGKERPETLDFVRACAEHWGIRVVWVERRLDAPDGFEEVGHNQASRAGEPFRSIIEKRRFLPNPLARFCTTEMKVKAMRLWMKSQGYGHYFNIIGLRADEPKRIAKQEKRNASGKEAFTSIMPLAEAGATKAEVLRYWAGQPFDLALPGRSDSFGNCDLCFLKARAHKLEVMLNDIHSADWWIECEDWAGAIAKKPSGAKFKNNAKSFRELRDYARDYPAQARAEVESYKQALRIKAGTGDLFAEGESIDCACTD